MVRGGPELRRRYLDRAVFTCDMGYLAAFHAYAKILKNRNALLKRSESFGLDVWTEQLADAALQVIARRRAYLAEIEKLLQIFYTEISGNDESVQIGYRLHGINPGDYDERPRETFLGALRNAAAEEKRRGTTLVGPHRDDVFFGLNGRSARHFASQGQQRSFVLALKMAEIEFIRTSFEAPPVLLLDDMTSELDKKRNHNLMEFLKKREMQVFITTTSLDNIALDSLEDVTSFPIREGTVARA